jgi:phytoene dehydrogenase-like protein
MAPAWRERIRKDRYDAIVVGSGPNGLAAAIAMAREGRSVLILEAANRVGGGLRSEALTLHGFVHDVCSAIHPLGVGSPFFQTLPLTDHGLDWVQPEAPVAHPLDDGTAVTLERSIDATAAGLGDDATAYRRLMRSFVEDWERLGSDILGPLRFPRHPVALARFGLLALRSARGLAESRFGGVRARALFAGIAAHAVLPLECTATAAVALVLSILGHVYGWPFPRGGTQSIANALTSCLRTLGGEVACGARVGSLDHLPSAQAVFLDLTPRQILGLTDAHLPPRYRRALERYRYGPGVFKIDLALDGPIPWTARDCARAATVHVGGTLSEIAASESAVWRDEHPVHPYVIVAQQSLFDPSRAPAGRHTVWAYCHVPNGSTLNMTDRIEAQIERFAPGFRDRILARNTMGPAALEERNPNYVGGDIGGGVQDLGQLFTRPVMSLVPYRTPVRGLYLCSSSTPPGGGVHGLCGYHAARTALQDLRTSS